MHRLGWAGTTVVALAGVALAMPSCAEWQPDPDGFTELDRAVIRAMELPTDVLPVDPTNAWVDDVNARRLGQALFFDPELSGALNSPIPGQVSLGNLGARGRIACVDCHEPTGFFDDQRTAPNNVSLGINFLGRNSPSLVNVGFYRQFAWDGRSDSLWMQCAVAHESGNATGGTRLRLARRLGDWYPDGYVRAFGDGGFDAFARATDGGLETAWDLPDAGEKPIAPESAQGLALNRVTSNGYKAMAAYISTLISTNAPIDRYARGQADALTLAQKRGLKLFLGKAGCIECHTGQHFTDNLYHSVGIGQRGPNASPTDLGRFTGLTEQGRGNQALFNRCGRWSAQEEGAWDGGGCTIPAPDAGDRGQFRTKSLRNIARTPPYMHAGQLQTLEDVVRFYNGGGESTDFAGTKSPKVVPLGLTDGEVHDLVAFLEALSGEPLPARLTCDNSSREADGGSSAHRFPACPPGGGP